MGAEIPVCQSSVTSQVRGMPKFFATMARVFCMIGRHITSLKSDVKLKVSVCHFAFIEVFSLMG